jgi:hypothetical protein
MKEIVVLIMFSGLVFIGFSVTLIVGIIKKNERLIIIAGMTFLLFIFISGYAGYKMITKTYIKVTQYLKPRTGEEVYAAVFGLPQNNCVKIQDYQDQVIPKIDYAIWLHFQSCPEELKRILSEHKFDEEKVLKRDLYTVNGPLETDSWFKPNLLGDTILVHTYRKDVYGNNLMIYSNTDQTEVYCIDIQN